jgi:hypothetical protein
LSYVKKVLPPAIITREEAKNWTCSRIYDIFRQQVLGQNMKVRLSGGVQVSNGFRSTVASILLPDENHNITNFVPEDLGFVIFRVEYEALLGHDEKMTRSEFLIEMLTLFDEWKGRLLPNQVSTIGEELDLTIAYVHKLYPVQALFDIDRMEQLCLTP